jgi:hypothetical protein
MAKRKQKAGQICTASVSNLTSKISCLLTNSLLFPARAQWLRTRALKLPAPNDLAPLRCMISKNRRRPVFNRFGEYLQQIAFVVTVNQDA